MGGIRRARLGAKMALYLIVELGNRVVLCHPEGDKELFANHDAAMDRATYISSINPGVFQVRRSDMVDKRFRWLRAITDKKGKILHYKGDAFGPMED